VGLLIGTSKILAGICKDNKLSGDALTLGHQRVLVTKEQVESEKHFPSINVSSKDNFEWHSRWCRNFITCDSFLKALGFSSVKSLDVSNYEGATIQFDMNSQKLPTDLHSSFDFIFDGSTLEHIFGVCNAICHIVRMLRIGGYVVHISPSNNWIDDGYYQFSPIFFKEFYLANGFDIVSLDFHQFMVRQDPKKPGIFETEDFVKAYNTNPIPEKELMSDGFSLDQSMPTQVIVVAKKIHEVMEPRFPNQARYSSKDYWQEGLN